MQRTFDENRLLGTVGEYAIEKLLGRHGYSFENNADAMARDGRGPSMITAHGKIPRPDFTLSRRGVSIAAEIKTKTDRTRGRYTGDVETGIDYRKWCDYKDYERETGTPVLLVFVEYKNDVAARILANPEVQKLWKAEQRVARLTCPDNVYTQWLAALETSLNTSTTCNGTEVVYFALKNFEHGIWNCVDLIDAYVNSHARTLA